MDEIGTVGGQTLQLRVFIVKSKGAQFSRERPERYPIHLSEYISRVLIDYIRVVLDGLRRVMDSAEIQVDQSVLLCLMNDMPMFPAVDFFEVRFDSLDLFKSLFTPKSTDDHISET
ncbi:hypothetical protein QFJ66_00250, partial [Raoultella terrigena]|uniref:hypothetical protein n=1 Tax=Raoultella terrigena TaxID=577 RepID=UPI002F94B3C8